MELINPEVRIEVSSLCNAHCTICPREKLTREIQVIDHDHFLELVRQSNAIGAKLISPFGFGEPLIDKRIEEKINYISRFGLGSFITTNASILSEERSHKLLKAGLRKIRFSVHGFNEGYEKVHRGLKWDRVFNNIVNFIAINEYDYSKQCRVAMSIIPMNRECIYYLKYLWEDKVDELEIWRPHNWVDGRNFRDVKKRKKTCSRPFNGPIQIQSDGKMIVCCFDYNGKMVVGDTYEQTIEEILKGRPFNEIRAKHRSGDVGGLICGTCDQLNMETESPLLYSTVDPNCEAGRISSTKFKLGE